jgi:ABC-2 type transport system ATP-binding protein
MYRPPAIEARELTRDYVTRRGHRRALDAVSFTVEHGQVVGMLGPNGAGKTTCVRILTTLLLPTSGVARIEGVDVTESPRAVQRMVGVSFGGDAGLYTRLSGRDNLRYFGTMYGLSGRQLAVTTDRLLERVGLAERGRDRVETYSRGMRQRLHIARALVHAPGVLILDEPSSGLDPAHARQLRDLVGNLRAEGHAVLLTTHDMLEAEQVCQQVVIVREGRIVKGATVRALREEVARVVGHRVEIESRIDIPDSFLAKLPGFVRVEGRQPPAITVFSHEPAAMASVLMEYLPEYIQSISISTPTLEDAYLATVA